MLATWTLGIVHQLHPDPDGHVRVVTVRTPHGLFKRSITKLATLLIEYHSPSAFILNIK